MRDALPLADVFNATGNRLFGEMWDGYEIWGRKDQDVSEKLEAISIIEEELSLLFDQLKNKNEVLKAALTMTEIQRANDDISNIKIAQNKLYAQLHEIGEVSRTKIANRGRWERFEVTEAYLLRAFRNGELTVQCFMGNLVKKHLWKEMPAGFGIDWELSLVLMPSEESSKRVNSARIDLDELETWIQKLIPLVPHSSANLTEEQMAALWFAEEVKNWDSKTTKSQFREIALSKFEISRRAFDIRIWDAIALDEMKNPGPKNG